ncbi:uncharacterized protein [Bactrocera oleae]|uniref:uncharacterized protein n=1 Tax=Bactrocera oleae TaxID=104688 RepID=UPI00387ECF01
MTAVSSFVATSDYASLIGVDLLSITYIKKANGFKPFVLNTAIHFCDYMLKKSNPIANLVYSLFKPFSNINHSCPYVGEQIVKNFYSKNELVIQTFLVGDYLLLLSWILNKKKTVTTNVYFTWNG